MPLRSAIGFWAVAAALIVVPGPDWAFAIGAGLRGQVKAAAGGIVLGYVAMTLVVAAGLGLLIASVPAALTALTVVGGLYLMWLGIKTARHPGVLDNGDGQPSAPASSTLLQGIAVSGLNPKGLLIFVAILPQFADAHGRWPIPLQLGVLGIEFALTSGVVYVVVGAASKRLLGARPRAAQAIARLSGSCMVVVGAALLAERLTT